MLRQLGFRHVSCWFVEASVHPVSYRNSLRIYHRWVKQKSLSPSRRQSPRSKVNICCLNTPEKSKRYTQLRSRLDAKSKKVKRLREKIAALTEKNHVILVLM